MHSLDNTVLSDDTSSFSKPPTYTVTVKKHATRRESNLHPLYILELLTELLEERTLPDRRSSKQSKSMYLERRVSGRRKTDVA